MDLERQVRRSGDALRSARDFNFDAHIVTGEHIRHGPQCFARRQISSRAKRRSKDERFFVQLDTLGARRVAHCWRLNVFVLSGAGLHRGIGRLYGRGERAGDECEDDKNQRRILEGK